MTQMRRTSCLFCYKNVSTEEISADNFTIHQNFFRLLKRYLCDENIIWQIQSILESNKTVKKPQMSSCPACLSILKSFCDYYCEIQKLELKLKWKLWTLNRIICNEETKSNFEKTVGVGVQRELKGSEISESHFAFDKTVRTLMSKLAEKCSKKLIYGYPKIVLSKTLHVQEFVPLDPLLYKTDEEFNFAEPKDEIDDYHDADGQQAFQTILTEDISELLCTQDAQQATGVEDAIHCVASSCHLELQVKESSVMSLKSTREHRKAIALKGKFRRRRRMRLKRHGMHKCPNCGEDFLTFNWLQRHRVLEHPYGVNCVVPGCGKRFIRERNMKVHVKLRHKNQRQRNLLQKESIENEAVHKNKSQFWILGNGEEGIQEDEILRQNDSHNSLKEINLIGNEDCKEEEISNAITLEACSSFDDPKNGSEMHDPDICSSSSTDLKHKNNSFHDEKYSNHLSDTTQTEVFTRNISSRLMQNTRTKINFEFNKLPEFVPPADQLDAKPDDQFDLIEPKNEIDEDCSNDVQKIPKTTLAKDFSSKFTCPECEREYGTLRSLQRHRMRKHPTVGAIQCVVGKCKRKFINKQSMRLHICRYHFNFDRLHLLKETAGTSTLSTPALILDYRKAIASTENIRRQERIGIQKSAKKITQSAIQSVRHRKNLPLLDFMKTEYNCQVQECNFKFYNQDDLNNHLKLHGLFQCSRCSFTESYAPRLLFHEKKHLEKKCTEGSDGPVLQFQFSCPRENCSYKSNDSYYSELSHHFLQKHLNLLPSTHTCPVCRKKFNYNATTQIHRHFKLCHGSTNMTDVKLFECDVEGCKAYFKKSSQLGSHKTVMHNEHCTHPCQDCDRRFPTLNSLRRHRVQRHSYGVQCIAQDCQKSFGTNESMRLHLKQHSNNDKQLESGKQKSKTQNSPMKTYKCGVLGCSETFYKEEDVQVHASLHGNFPCSHCDDTFNYAPDLAIHEIKHENLLVPKKRLKPKCSTLKGKSIFCPRCNFRTIFQLRYIQHHLEFHQNLRFVHKNMCTICKFVCINDRYNQVLDKHIKVHHDLAGLEPSQVVHCDVGCNAYFRSRVQLLVHRNVVHYVEHKVIKCPKPDCGEMIKVGPRNLLLHLQKMHLELYPVACIHEGDGCSKRYENEALMLRHVKLCHNNSPNEVCPECGKEFKGSGALATHLKRQHPNTICPECGKKFQCKTKLEKHILGVHVGPDGWPFCCDLCGKKSLTKERFENHQRTHTDEKPYACEYCENRYTNRCNFKNHLKNKHGVQLEKFKRYI